MAQEGDFSGPRAEAVFGWDHSDKATSREINGLVYGGAIGYDWQHGNMVFGVEGEITGSTIKDEINRGADYSLSGSIGRDLYAGGRVGLAVGAGTLLYAKGGYTNVGGRFALRSPLLNYDGEGNEGGWRVGAGAEVRLAGKTYLKSEYRYSDYGSSRHQVVTGLGIRF